MSIDGLDAVNDLLTDVVQNNSGLVRRMTGIRMACENLARADEISRFLRNH
jgi:hypothetical protein